MTNQAGRLTLFENKLRIVTPKEHAAAVNQGKSYALMLGLPSFVVASPEGLKLYALAKGAENLVAELLPRAEKNAEDEFYGKLQELQRSGR